jgi:NADPH:quinone reductase-like Zn-dependent oxidoreductase
LIAKERLDFLLAGYAEYLTVHARTLAPMPPGLSFTDAAAVPEAFVTAWDAMVLVHAADSGVGTAAIQIARAIGARSIGTARTADKLERARPLGLDEGVLAEGGKFADEVRKRTGGRGVDVVVELVGGAYVPQDLACLATKGRIVVVGMMAGMQCDLDLGALMRKRAEIRGTMLRSRPIEEKSSRPAPSSVTSCRSSPGARSSRSSRRCCRWRSGRSAPLDAEQREVREDRPRDRLTVLSRGGPALRSMESAGSSARCP